MELAEAVAPHSDRPTVVLLHSLGTDHRLWRHQISSLTTHYDLSTPDSRGHGKSSATGAINLDAWSDDLYRVVKDRGPVHLVGLSMGGLQAIAFAAKHPDLVRSVTIANSFARLPIDVADAHVNGSTESIIATAWPHSQRSTSTKHSHSHSTARLRRPLRRDFRDDPRRTSRLRRRRSAPTWFPYSTRSPAPRSSSQANSTPRFRANARPDHRRHRPRRA